MSIAIGISGKGGVGKTTFAALSVMHLVRNGLKPVLAVDADPNSNLHMMLGVDLPFTIGAVREEMSEKIQRGELPAGMSKQDMLEMQIEQALVETPDFDLISMGRPEGPGCYCAINNMLRLFLDRLSARYKFVVIDNEAGMEHLSRRTTRSVDFMFIISDPSSRGLETAARIKDLAVDMRLNVGRFLLVVSRVPEDLDLELEKIIENSSMEFAGLIPDDPLITNLDASGHSLKSLDKESVALGAVGKILDGTVLFATQRE